MKYNQQLAEVQRLLPNAQNILIALPANPTVDTLAAGLSLYLSLQQVQRPASIISDGPILVGHTNLFGVGQILNKLPQAAGGDYVLTLTGVANPNDPDKPVPSVEKMDYKTEGSDLKLIFKVVPGQKFEPQAVVPSYSGGNFDLIFVLGSSSLQTLGNIYTSNPGIFNGTHVVNIDNQANNSQFGATNVVDLTASSVSEILAQVFPGLSLPMEGDIATNILSGIFTTTNNLTSGNVSPDTFLIVAEAMRAGGQKPTVLTQSVNVDNGLQQTQTSATPLTNTPTQSTEPISSANTASEPTSQPVVNIQQSGAASWTPDQQALNQAWAQAFKPSDVVTPTTPSQAQPQQTVVSPVATQAVMTPPSQPLTTEPSQAQANSVDLNPVNAGNPEQSSESSQVVQSSPEEMPVGEGVTMEGEVINPEPDWLTPKIFKGGGMG